MDILAFTDIHEDWKAIEGIKKKAQKADLLICAGDLSNFGKGLDKAGKLLNSIGKTILMIPGNHESEQEIKELCF